MDVQSMMLVSGGVMAAATALAVVTVKSAGAVLAADLMSGVVHWAEDAYARLDTPIVGKLIGQANIEHHIKPRAFVERSYLQSSRDLILLSLAVVATAWWCKFLSWPIVVFAIAAANANQIHKWAHSPPHENGRLVTLLQRVKLLQTQRHHGRHHSGNKDSYYCSITNVVNPVLERIKLWQGLERFNRYVFGLTRKEDPSVKRVTHNHTAATD
jgi:plasmanylethanolamine desaturase